MPKVLDALTEVSGWLRIVLSFALIGAGIGAAVYFPSPSSTRLIIGIAIAAATLLTGIILATRMLRGKGTIWFLSRTMATPELDKPSDNDTGNDEQSKGRGTKISWQ